MDAPKRKDATKKKEVGEKLTPITWKERKNCERPRSFQCKKGETGVVIKSWEMILMTTVSPCLTPAYLSSIVRMLVVGSLLSGPNHLIQTCITAIVTDKVIDIRWVILQDAGGPELFHFLGHPGYLVCRRTSRSGWTECQLLGVVTTDQLLSSLLAVLKGLMLNILLNSYDILVVVK